MTGKMFSVVTPIFPFFIVWGFFYVLLRLRFSAFRAADGCNKRYASGPGLPKWQIGADATTEKRSGFALRKDFTYLVRAITATRL